MGNENNFLDRAARLIAPIAFATYLSIGSQGTVAQCNGPCGEVTLEQMEMVSELREDLRQRSADIASMYGTTGGGAVGAINDCLGRMRGIDISGLIIDPTAAISGIIEGLKREIFRMACNAASTWVNEQARQLEDTINSPNNAIEARLRDIGIRVQSERDRIPIPSLPPWELEERAGPSIYEGVVAPPRLIPGADADLSEEPPEPITRDERGTETFQGLDTYFKTKGSNP